jgi:hypothetical protein
MAWTAAATIGDEGFHPRNDDPWWNESSFLTFRIPDRDLLGILYFYFRPNQNTAMGGPIILDPTSEDLATCRHAGWGWHMPIPPGADMFDFALANGFTSQTLEPQHSYRHTYTAAGCSFDLTYTADGPPLVMADKKGGLSDFVDDTDQQITTGHFEQFGVINGTLELDDETIQVTDAGVFRDRSWGPRPVLQAQDKTRGALLFARADADHAFQAWTNSVHPWTDDPIDDAEDAIVSGFYVRDGLTGTLTSGTRRVLERAPSGRVLREVVEATDEHGRTLHAEGLVTAGIRWPGLYGDITAFWCHEHWTLDGQPAPGEVQEWIMARHFARWHHNHRQAVGR